MGTGDPPAGEAAAGAAELAGAAGGEVGIDEAWIVSGAVFLTAGRAADGRVGAGAGVDFNKTRGGRDSSFDPR